MCFTETWLQESTHDSTDFILVSFFLSVGEREVFTSQAPLFEY